MTLGLAERQGDLFDDVDRFCAAALPVNSVFAVLHRERDGLFPDEMFADLFAERGRRSVPPSVVATVMVLQRLEGLSDREAVERYSFDARWRYAAGVGGYDGDGWARFAHTVLVDMRARLGASDDPRRIFRVTLDAASAAGLVGAKRVLDSTPLYDAVATMDTITLIRSAIRGLLRVADEGLAAALRDVLSSGDDYAGSAKPQIDWDDAPARELLIDSRARDAFSCLAVLDGRGLDPAVVEAATLLATVAARTWNRPTMVASGSPGGSQRTGSSPPSTPTPGTATRPRRGASTATRVTSRSTRTARSSPTPRSARATWGTRRSPSSSSTTCSTPTPAPTRGRRRTQRPPTTTCRRPSRRETPGRSRGPSTATPLTAAGSSWTGSPKPGSTPAARPSGRPLPGECSPRTSSPSTSTMTP